MPQVEPTGHAADIQRDGVREFEICNACRYCEGFCAVFPAMMLRREFASGDLNYLANLCHNCNGCYHACQYAPPHPFGVNLPQTLSKLRLESYEQYAWPGAIGRIFRKNGLLVSGFTAIAVALTLILTGLFNGSVGLARPHLGVGAFYAVMPWRVMASVAGLCFMFSLLALVVGGVRFWRDTGGAVITPQPIRQALRDIFTLRYLGGGHGGKDGCNDRDENFSQSRRRFHHIMFYGFLLCFASTTVATIYDHFLGRVAPYPLLSLPVVLGTLGGIGLIVGPLGLVVIKVMADPAPTARSVLGADYASLALLLAIAASGLLLLALRGTAAMGILLALHLGFVFSFFLLMPYSKMVHGLYRSLALLRYAIETRESRLESATSPD